MKVYICGYGGIGGYLAGIFSSYGIETVVITDSFQPKPLGLVINGKPYQTGRISFSKTVDATSGIVFLCCKTTSIHKMVSKIPEGYRGQVISLQNGLGFHEDLRIKFINFIPGTIGKIIAKRLNEEISIETSSIPEISLYFKQNVNHELVNMIKSSGIGIIVKNSFQELIWEKYARLAFFSIVTTFFRDNIGQIFLFEEKVALVNDLAKEMAIIANAEGFLTTKEILLSFIKSLPIGATSSLSRDILNGNKSEYEAILAPLIKISKDKNLECSNINIVCDEISKWIKR
jgi:ketopantoate reductase